MAFFFSIHYESYSAWYGEVSRIVAVVGSIMQMARAKYQTTSCSRCINEFICVFVVTGDYFGSVQEESALALSVVLKYM